MMKNSGDKLLSLTMIRIVGLAFGIVVVITQPPLDFGLFPYLIAASCVHFIYFYCLINAYKFGDFSLVYPISRGLAPLLILIISLVFLNESLSVYELIGTLAICCGVLMLAALNGRADVRPIVFAFGTASCIASYTIITGIGVRMSESVWVYMGWLELMTGIAVVIFTGIRRKKAMLQYIQGNAVNGLVAGSLSISAFFASVWAISRVPMAPVAALRETSIIFAVLIGVLFMKEAFARSKIIASIIVVAGIILLAQS